MLNNSAHHHEVLSGRYDLVSLLENDTKHYPFLLETTAQTRISKSTKSAESNTPTFDILFAFPQQQLVKHSNNTVTLDGHACASSIFLDELDLAWKKDAENSDQIPELPFSGGWFVYLGYELTSEVEPTICMNKTNQDLPDAFATRIPAAIIYDHTQNQTHIVVEDTFKNLSADIKSSLEKAGQHTSQKSDKPKDLLINNIKEDEPGTYLDSVGKVLDYIREGDVFQVNLSRQWEAELKDDITDVDVYRKLRTANPAPFSAMVKFNQTAIVSSSPERLFCTDARTIETRPIAGTRPRGQTPLNDEKLQSELISNHKERAEHIMLIDLERNDLGRICQPGTIHVDEFMLLESYAHVHHIVSNVSGELQQNITPGQIIKAVFPGGTITGCPKVRCMEIIAELEQAPRGAYTGSLGFLNHNGNMDMNILIRTLTIHNKQVTFRAGAGIVTDSIAENELDETRAKAKGIIMALCEQEREDLK